MNIFKSITLNAIASALLLTTSSFADIINIPDDFETIQEGIDDAEDGDTVLVAPGEYEENLLVEDVDGITVASLMLTTGIEAYIDSTVIDGGGESSVVRFEEVGDQFIFNGFTLINGTGSLDVDRDICGGGIHCFFSSPTLINLIIRDNSAEMGGGVFLQLSSPSISYCRIVNNEAEVTGGGIFCSREGANPIIFYTLIACNDAGNRADGIGAYDFAAPLMQNVTIVDNDEFGIFLTDGSELEISNSIVWNCDIGAQWGENSLTLSYCDVQDGEREIDNCDVEWGEGVIDEDPLFVDADEGDYHLTVDSPCIDTGDPDSPDDPDGTRADMGAYPIMHLGTLEGHVVDAADDEQLENAMVTTSYGRSIQTDEDGFWLMEMARTGDFSLTASAQGYNDSTRIDLHLDENDTLEIDFGLLHPEFTIRGGGDSLRFVLPQDTSVSTHFQIENSGNGTLWYDSRYINLNQDMQTYTPSKKNAPGLYGTDEQWDILSSWNVSEVVWDNRIQGIAFDGQRWIISGANDVDRDNNSFYIFNRDGSEYLGAVDQPPDLSRYGIKDMDFYDGYLYGASDGSEIIRIDPETYEVDQRWRSSDIRRITALTVTHEGQLIASHIVGEVYIYDVDDDTLSIADSFSPQDPQSGRSLLKYGMAWYRDDADGYSLYLMAQTFANEEGVYLYKIDIETGEALLVSDFPFLDEGFEGKAGITIIPEWDNMVSVLAAILDHPEGDRAFIFDLGPNTRWIDYSPKSDTLNAGEEIDVELLVDTEGLESGDYGVTIEFVHNTIEGFTRLPVSLMIPVSVGDEPELPQEFALHPAYPNPFNSFTIITYSLPLATEVSMQLYNLSGREVRTLVKGNKQAGVHRAMLNSNNLPSGLYFVRLGAANKVATRKVMLIR